MQSNVVYLTRIPPNSNQYLPFNTSRYRKLLTVNMARATVSTCRQFIFIILGKLIFIYLVMILDISNVKRNEKKFNTNFVLSSSGIKEEITSRSVALC